VGRGRVLDGGTSDVAGHPAEDNGVERPCGGPVRVPGQASGQEHGTLMRVHLPMSKTSGQLVAVAITGVLRDGGIGAVLEFPQFFRDGDPATRRA
jgi:hypothetical protein